MTKERIFQHFKPYPGYRASGFPWLGSVPAEWKPKRLRFACAVNPSTKTDLPPDALVTFAPMETVGQLGGMDAEEKELDSIGSGYTAFKNEDVLIAKITPCFENGKGALAKELSNGIGFGSTEFHILRHGKETSPRYLFYLSISDFFRKIGAAFMTGAAGQKRVPTDFIKNFPFPCPPFVQQEKIADFLDEQCERIDSIITKKRRILELLDEKRNAIITNAVTKGIKQNVEMKDSGIELTNNIPSHWSTIELRYLCKITTGDSDTQNSDENGIYNFYVRSPIIEKSNTYTFEGEGILMAGDGVGAGKVFHHAFGKYAIHQRVYCFYDFENINTDYLFLFMSNLYLSEINKGSAQSTVPSVRLPMLKKFKVCVPPSYEQKSIVEYLQSAIQKIDAQKSLHQRTIDLLLEYRASLITQAVTGKIDVRNWQQCA